MKQTFMNWLHQFSTWLKQQNPQVHAFALRVWRLGVQGWGLLVRFWGWFKVQKRGPQIAVGVVALAVLAICANLTTAVTGLGNINTDTTTTANSQTTSNVTTFATATQEPTATTVIHSTPLPANGPPVLGGPLANFTMAYGTPSQSGSTFQYDTENNNTIIFADDDARTIVTVVTVSTQDNWSDQQTIGFCAQFLPSGAVMFNQDGPYIDYHSSLGEIIMQHSAGTCMITGSQS